MVSFSELINKFSSEFINKYGNIIIKTAFNIPGWQFRVKYYLDDFKYITIWSENDDCSSLAINFNRMQSTSFTDDYYGAYTHSSHYYGDALSTTINKLFNCLESDWKFNKYIQRLKIQQEFRTRLNIIEHKLITMSESHPNEKTITELPNIHDLYI